MFLFSRNTAVLRRLVANRRFSTPSTSTTSIENNIGLSSTPLTPIPSEMPSSTLGLFKVFMVALISLMAGAKTAEFGASFLEESEIFVRSSDDDDD
ncbi:hypothetical protein ACQ4LE_010222 [Meloidogyne hapla]